MVTVLVPLLLLAVSSPPAGAADDANSALYLMDGAFDDLDTNSDGFISREEFANSSIDVRDDLELEVDRLDLDSDGVISEKEFEAQQEKVLRRFRYCNVCDIDANQDAFLSDEEFERYYEKSRDRFFNRMDGDRDERITQKEWTLFRF